MNNVIEKLEFNLVLEQIAAFASFSLGKEEVLNTKPSYSKLIVSRNLALMSDALECTIKNGSFAFTGLSDISGIVQHAEKSATLHPEDIALVGRFIKGVQRVKAQFDAFEEKYDHLNDLFESLMGLASLDQAIYHALGDGSRVLDSASAHLRETRRAISQLEGSIDKKLQDYMQKHKDSLSENIISLQQGRQTFLIKPSEKNKLEGTIYGASASGQSLYFEPSFLSRYQNELNQLKHSENMEIDRICGELSFAIKEESVELLANLETTTLLDALFAKAAWASKHDGVVASLNDDHLLIKDARHPLIDPKNVVSNTYTMLPPHKMVLISGPNTGGKSVSLKTMGLTVLMTLSGCPVLAQEAEVMMVDNIFVDIGDQQSIEKNLSSFSAHIETIKQVTQEATGKSFILLDELGSQTDPLEGESLSMAILDYFRKIGSYVVATTHFSGLKKYGTMHDDILVSSVAFDLNTLSPTYRYQENVMGDSNAFAIAKKLGLQDDIIDAAFSYKQASQYETDHLMEILEARIFEAEEMKKELAEKEAAFENQELAMTQKQAEMVAQFENEKAQWQAEQEALLADKLAQADMLIEDINKASRPDFRKEARENIASMIDDNEVLDETIKVGDRVQLNATNQVGTVESIERKTAFVSIGGLKVSVNLNKISKVAEKVQPKRSKVRRSHSVKTLSTYKLETNVIGMRVAEALPLVDKYIDECAVHNVKQARIVHGHGTGALRTAVHESLRKNKHVRSFELATLGEGGAGATIVHLK